MRKTKHKNTLRKNLEETISEAEEQGFELIDVFQNVTRQGETISYHLFFKERPDTE